MSRLSSTIVPTISIEPQGIEKRYIRDLWIFRELLLLMTWRNLLLRYKQTVIGILWVLIRPIVPMFIFTVLFYKIGKFPSGDVPYTLLVLCGYIIWQYISSVASECSSTLIDHAMMIRKVYFPRALLIGASALSYLLDVFVMLAFFVVFSYLLGFPLGLRALWMVPILMMTIVLGVGVGLWISTFTVRYRDFKHTVPFLLQIGLYLSPVAYTSVVVPDRWLFLYYVNPIAGLVEATRYVLLGHLAPNLFLAVIASTVFSFLLFFTGFQYFRKTERAFAEWV